MAKSSTKKSTQSGFSTSRLEAFSDAVFAIATTLLVLDIAIPENTGNELLRALVNLWPSYLAYIVSFATIGEAWYAHSIITEYLERSDSGLVRLNLLLLMVVAFLPFPTKLLAEFIGTTNTERVTGTFYGLTLASISVLMSLLWRYAVNHRLVRDDSERAVAVISARLKPSLFIYAAFIVLGLYLPVVAVVGYLLIVFFILFPPKRR